MRPFPFSSLGSSLEDAAATSSLSGGQHKIRLVSYTPCSGLPVWDLIRLNQFLVDRKCANGSVATIPPCNPTTYLSMTESRTLNGYELVDFADIAAIPCPCGMARRAFADVTDFPGTIHVTEISENARMHYHKTLTETYYFLSCEPDAQMQLDNEQVPVRPGMSVMIRPGTRHRAIGKMRVLIVVFPKFDPRDEWFDVGDEAST